ncbi:glycosyltransferase family 32 protein [Limosilactobacillus secaliphilus]|uniref:Glycosyl transferase n=1 Tax=Limosilactobacillus secaliphilus TaxID=396268 RepID=A0A0R2HZR5_9LACO|nr:glycosyltransferase [Limosilactobacillus secaliphilus]KRN58361.1 hypothetical protein IV45_GL000807 [Limosilactobacillus secaliphilus]
MISKKIHYIWFGESKPNSLIKAIKTWERHAPKYEIIEWNEENLPKYKNNFYQRALSNKDYAFASDYARLKILQQYGGVYMDTDMYLLKDPSNILANKELAFSIQDPKVIISTSFIAACPGQDFINKAIELYDNLPYEFGKNRPNTEVLSPLLFKMYKFNHSIKTQRRGKVTAFEPDIFLQPSFKTVALHIGEKAWAPHTTHDKLRIIAREHITNQISAGIFRIANDFFRKII